MNMVHGKIVISLRSGGFLLQHVGGPIQMNMVRAKIVISLPSGG